MKAWRRFLSASLCRRAGTSQAQCQPGEDASEDGGQKSGHGDAPSQPARGLSGWSLASLEEVGDFEQDELVVIGLVGLTRGREGQVVVVAHHDVAIVHLVDVFDGEKWEGQHAIVERLACLAIGILDFHQVDEGDL